MAAFGKEIQYYDEWVWSFILSYIALLLVQRFVPLIETGPELINQFRPGTTISFFDLIKPHDIHWLLLLGPAYAYWRKNWIRIGFRAIAFLVIGINFYFVGVMLLDHGTAVGWHFFGHPGWYELSEESRASLSIAFAQGSETNLIGFGVVVGATVIMTLFYINIRFADKPISEEQTIEIQEEKEEPEDANSPGSRGA